MDRVGAARQEAALDASGVEDNPDAWIAIDTATGGVMDLRAFLAARATAPTLDDQTAAALAAAVYKDPDTGLNRLVGLQGWNILIEANEAGGYDATALHHPASRSLVIANRGTEGFRSFADWWANVSAVLLHDPDSQIIPALGFLRRAVDACVAAALPADQLLITGHSLGGGLADIQGALARAVAPAAPAAIRVVGVASAGFANAGAGYAFRNGLALDPAAPGFIKHYVRELDLVPHHPARSVFGQDHKIASVWQARRAKPPHGDIWEYTTVYDFLRNHDYRLYCEYLMLGMDHHLWYSQKAKAVTARAGEYPTWDHTFIQPDDY